MMVKTYLENLKSQYMEEKLNIEKEIASLQMRLRENLEFTKLLEKNDDPTYESFTPRGRNSKINKKIQELQSEKQELLLQVDFMKAKQEESEEKIEELKEVIKAATSAVIPEEQSNSDCGNQSFTFLSMIEKENRRMSERLTDSVIQNLTGLMCKAKLCSRLIEIDRMRCKLELDTMSKSLSGLIDVVNQMIDSLNPLSQEEISFSEAVENVLNQIKEDTKFNDLDFTIEGEPIQVNSLVRITIIKMIQLICLNTINCLEVSHISIKIKYKKDKIKFIMDYDGKQFDLEDTDLKEKFDFLFLKEMVSLTSGLMNIESHSICIEIPVKQEGGS